MNPQKKYKNGQLVGRGIEWTEYTWNPIGGCKHACRWTMPDGTTAICYAESVAENVAQAAYPLGFAHHYFHPQKLDEPLKLKTPVRIFLDSMSDLMGHWIPDHQILAVLIVASKAHWHTFQLLTKNSPRLLKFVFPANVHVGSSMPPDFFMGNELTPHQKEQKLRKDLTVLQEVARRDNVTWMSFEPLSWDVAPIVAEYPGAIKWAVIGAASNGPKKYQPDSSHVSRLLDVLDGQGVAVFFKGNLQGNPAANPWREEFPQMEAVR